ncbi:MAG: dephospho-CoA kinase [Flavobacteriales bacterium]|jgi:dephospho-CoA kinase|nr:dephospho-CoA kinase [Flavobacteriales bacterium]
MKTKMVLGITGGIGSGKSTICRVFQEMGFPVYYADDRAKLILNSKIVLQEIQDVFGSNVFTNAQINRKKLAQIVFNNPKKLKELNAIIHPRVRRDFQEWLTKQDHKICIKEAAIMIEIGDTSVDKICSVLVPKDIRIKRVIKRDLTSNEEVIARINNQIEDQERIEKSDFIIHNNQELIIPQVLKILHTLEATSPL